VPLLSRSVDPKRVKMTALPLFETSVTIYQSTKLNIAEDLKLQQRLMRIVFNKRGSSAEAVNFFFLTRAVWESIDSQPKNTNFIQLPRMDRQG
jgi:hypothetical protein